MIWRYLDGTTTVPATGLESATVTIDVPGPGGLCNVRFMLNGGSTVLAASETFDIPSVPLEMNVLTPSVYPHAPIDLAVRNAPGNAGGLGRPLRGRRGQYELITQMDVLERIEARAG